MKNYSIVVLVLFFTLSYSAKSQTFAPTFKGYSSSKITSITMEDGAEMKVKLKGYKVQKGLIKEIKVRDESDEKIRIDPAKIKHMYIPPSKLGQFLQITDAAHDLTKIQDGELDQSYLKDGYVYMVKTEVQIKKSKQDSYMLQLINPSFSGKIKVYADPNAKETASIGMAGMTVTGGLDKSYYIKKAGENVAFQLRKKDYKKQFNELFADCPKLIEKYGDKPDWADLELVIYELSVDCDN